MLLMDTKDLQKAASSAARDSYELQNDRFVSD